MSGSSSLPILSLVIHYRGGSLVGRCRRFRGSRDSFASCLMLKGAVRGAIEMADWFYCVDLSRDEDSARERRYVEKFLIELICEDHSNGRHYESYRETSACDIAMNAFENRYGSQTAEDIGYKRANRYRGIVPTNLGEASFTASCGCLAWHF
jgi:hypothetical protein